MSKIDVEIRIMSADGETLRCVESGHSYWKGAGVIVNYRGVGLLEKTVIQSGQMQGRVPV